MQAILAVHIAAGTLSVLAGAAALIVRKGERAHRMAGSVFVGAMTVMAVGAALLGNVGAGVVTIYFVLTAWMAGRRPDGQAGAFEIGAAVAAFAGAAATLASALAVASGAKPAENPYIATAQFIFTGVLALAGGGDLSVALRRGVSGAQRIARHLWRMCFAFLIAMGSFAAQGVDALPRSLPRGPMLLAVILLLVVVMLYWSVRVLFTGRWAGRPQPATDGA